MRNGNTWHSGMKMHVAVNDSLDLIHSLTTTPAHVHDITQVDWLLHVEKECVWGDAGYRSIEECHEHEDHHVDGFIGGRVSERSLRRRILCQMRKTQRPAGGQKWNTACIALSVNSVTVQFTIVAWRRTLTGCTCWQVLRSYFRLRLTGSIKTGQVRLELARKQIPGGKIAAIRRGIGLPKNGKVGSMGKSRKFVSFSELPLPQIKKNVARPIM